MQLTKVERLATKLSIMSYMGNFLDNLHLISPVSIDSINKPKSCNVNFSFLLLICSKYMQLYQLQVR